MQEIDLPDDATIYYQGSSDDVPAGWRSFDEGMNKASNKQPDVSIRSEITARDAICYIFTSGTTGGLTLNNEEKRIK